MKNFRNLFCLLTAFVLMNGSASAQNNDRISKMTRIGVNGATQVYQLSYDEKNRIKSFDYLKANGKVDVSITDFIFDNSNRPIAYKVYYKSDGDVANVTLQYDSKGRLSELKKTLGRDIVTYSYNYTRDVITREMTQTEVFEASNNVTGFYNESGDYIETSRNATTQKMISVTKLSANRKAVPHAGILVGDFEEPEFMGVQSNGLDANMRINDTKDASGRVVRRDLLFSGKTKSITYEYAVKKVNADNKADSIKVTPHIPPPKQNTADPESVTPPSVPPTEVTKSKKSIIQGRLFYRYKKEGEKPVSTNFNLTSGYKTIGKQQNGMPIMGTAVYYPEYLADRRYPVTEPYYSKALKNVRIMLVYEVFASKDLTPANYEKYLQRNWGIADGTKQEEYYIRARLNPVVWQGTTNADGSFSIPFENDFALGYLGSFKEEHRKKDFTHYANGPGDHSSGALESFGTMQMHGFLRIVVDDKDFYSPEILMLPKPGETLKIPDEVALVNSFTLKVKVVTDASMDQAVSGGAPLTNYRVKAGALKSSMNDPTAPYESMQQDMKGASDETSDGEKFMLFDEQLTDGNGEINFTNLCYRKSHVIKSPESMYDGSFVYKSQDQKLAAVISTTQRDSLKYNSDFTPPVKNVTMVLSPKLPELYLRAITNVGGQTKGLQGVKVGLKRIIGPFVLTTNYVTLRDGYLQVKDLPVEFGTEKAPNGKTLVRVTGPKRRLELSMPGYKTVQFPGEGKTEILQLGQRWPKPTEIIMNGDAALTGSVENEAGEGVICDLKVGDGPFIKTQKAFPGKGGFFFVSNCQAGEKIRVVIIPSVDQYFSDTVLVSIKPGGITKLPTVVLKEKLHRVIFKVTDANGKAVANADVIFNNSAEAIATNSAGVTKTIAIASPGKEFNIRVKAKGFVDYDDYVIVPVNKEAITIPIKFTKGIVISGTVKEEKTGKPIAKARVYTITGYNEDGEIQQETYTDANGHYELAGIAQKGYFMNPGSMNLSSSAITVYAVKSGNPGYIQNSRKVKSADYDHADLELTPFDCKSEIWGLPVEITDVQQRGSNIKISGAFVKIPANASFRAARAEARLPFKDVEIKVSKQKDLGGGKILNGDCSLEPVKNSIETEVSELKMIVFDKFNCTVTGAESGRGFENLVITKSSGNCGVLKGFVKTKLESFNFSYNYTGSFILQPVFTGKNPALNAAKKNEMIDVAGGCAAVADKYRLSTDDDHRTFMVNNFTANFRSWDSYVVKDTFSLGVDAAIDIPLVKDKSIDAGSIKVLQNGIVWKENTNDINIPIETWRIKGKGIQYDKNLGGFRIGNAVLQTNLPELPLKTLVIKPKLLEIGNENFNSAEGISLAGIKNLSVSDSKVSLVFEQSAPQDHKSHWRVNLTNDKGPAAYLEKIPGLADNDKINVVLFSNYSDGKKTLNIDQSPHKFFSVLTQYVGDIEIGSNYFTLIGRTDLDIPGCNKNITGRFRYMKSGNDLSCTVEKLNTDAELEGKVFFSGKQSIDDYTVREGYFSANGTALLYQKTKEDGMPLKATMIKDASGTRMKLEKGQVMPIGAQDQKMIIDTGLAVVRIGKWENLKFTAELKGYKAVDQKRNKIDFIVQGAIKNDKGSSIGIDNIQTPFGGMDISFDFDKKIFAGSLNINTSIPVPPFFVINSGISSMQIDPKGLIISGAFDDVTFTPLTALGAFKCGLAIGYYSTALPPKIAADLKAVTVRKAIPASISNGLKGMYISVAKEFNESLETPFFGTPKAEVKAGIEMIAAFNFANGFDPLLEGYCGASARCSIDVLDCKNFVEVSSSMNPVFNYNKTSGLTMSAEAKMGGAARICPAPQIDATLGIKIGIDKGKFTFSPSIN